MKQESQPFKSLKNNSGATSPFFVTSISTKQLQGVCSNGMAEAFVKTIKRDYVYVSDCDTAESVLKQLKRWVLDYNNEAPHLDWG